MKKFRYTWLLLIGVTVLVFIGANWIMLTWHTNEDGRLYRVEINRLCREIEKNSGEVSTEEYSFITGIYKLSPETEEAQKAVFFQGKEADYVIRKINGDYYRIEYETGERTLDREILVAVNVSLGCMAVVIFGMMAYLQHNLIRPFQKISEMPYELAKGNLQMGLKENKNRFFGRFIWGLDLLREQLELEKRKEMEFQKEKQTLMLSISHDTKTPLSAIKLYAKALERNLYDTEEKRNEIAENINKKAEEIENFINEIIKTSNEEFLDLEVKEEEFYLRELQNEIQLYYQEKLKLLRISFSCDMGENCLIKGELDRAVEVIQNIIENAIKYGDGEYIRIDFEEEEDYRILNIKNSGCELKKDEVLHIFESFWRGSNTKSQPGSGLGLYICRQLIRKMDGDIYAQVKEKEMQVSVVFRRA